MKMSKTFIQKGQRLSPGTEFKKGQISPRKGVKLTEETKRKLSESHKGIIPATAFKKGNRTGADALARWRASGGKPWNKGKKWPEISGENHWNWQNGKTERLKALRESFEYNEWRRKVFERDNYTCQGCGQIGGYLEANHKKSFALYPDLRFEVDNGETLCKPCHVLTDTYGYKTRKLLKVENIGG